MRLFEAILEANHKLAPGNKTASIQVSEYAQALPVVALTCIDSRLNSLLPAVLGIAEEHFVWLRNAGNVITSTTSSTMRSLALGCAIKGGKELAVIGHTDCRAGQTTVLQLIDAFKALGIERSMLPENLPEYFGLFASERQNVLKAVDFIRRSPLIGPALPVHGLLVDIHSGRLEWLVNGYQALDTVAARFVTALKTDHPSLQSTLGLATPVGFHVGDVTLLETKAGEVPLPPGEKEEVKVTEPPPRVPPEKFKAEKGTPPPLHPEPPPFLRPRPQPPRKRWWQ